MCLGPTAEDAGRCCATVPWPKATQNHGGSCWNQTLLLQLQQLMLPHQLAWLTQTLSLLQVTPGLGNLPVALAAATLLLQPSLLLLLL